MFDKLIYVLLLISLFLGLFIIIGTAGASDLESIGLKDFVIRGGIGLILMIIGLVGLEIGGFDICQDSE